MPHTHSTIEMVFYYIGAVLYGNLPALSHGLGALALLLLSALAFRSRNPFLLKQRAYRWYFLLFAAAFGLMALNDIWGGVLQFKVYMKLSSAFMLLLLAVSMVRLFRMKRSLPSIK